MSVISKHGPPSDVCLSSVEFCEANPLIDRGDVKRGMTEWFIVERGSAIGDAIK